MPATTSPAPLAYELRVTLSEIAPEIWRTVRVPSDIRMDRLHDVLQAAFGWTNSHLHQFIIARKGEALVLVANKSQVDAAWPDDKAYRREERRIRLDRFLSRVGERLEYLYDFGDCWEHVVEVVAELPQTSRMGAALCLDGARACPPEDCGGAYSYGDLLEAIDDPEHEDHVCALRWVGGKFDPASFDLGKTARAVALVKL